MRGLARARALSVEEPLREITNPVIRLTTHEARTRKILNFISIGSRFESRAGWSDKPQNSRANVRLRNVHRSPLPVPRDDEHQRRPRAQAGVDRPQAARIKFLPTSTPGSDSIRQGAQVLDR